jgi:hypothetical protein
MFGTEPVAGGSAEWPVTAIAQKAGRIAGRKDGIIPPSDREPFGHLRFCLGKFMPGRGGVGGGVIEDGGDGRKVIPRRIVDPEFSSHAFL